jgi:hypothetical protein
MVAEQKATYGFNSGAMGIGTSAVPAENRTPALAEVGIDKKLSSRTGTRRRTASYQICYGDYY